MNKPNPFQGPSQALAMAPTAAPTDLNRRQFKHWLALAPLGAVAALSALGALKATPARAHGERHGKPAGPVVKEQKPWGIAADPAQAKRRIDIAMDDQMRFTPNHLEVKLGDSLRLRAVNQGRVMHELVIGTPEELAAHAELMRKHPNMEHDEPYMVHVAPAKRGEIAWTFNRPGNFEFACLIPGHFEAGMRGTIRVQPLPA